MKNIFKLIVINLIPVVLIQFLFMFLWIRFIGNDTEFIFDIPFAQTLLNLFFIPILLLFLNFRFKSWKNTTFFIISLALMLGMSYIGNKISFFSWGISTGLLNNPDTETLVIVHFEILVSSVLILISSVLLYLLYRRREKKLSTNI